MKKILFLTIALVGLALINVNAQSAVTKAELKPQPVEVNADLQENAPKKIPAQTRSTNVNAGVQTPADNTNAATKRTATPTSKTRVFVKPEDVPATKPVIKVDPKSNTPK